MSFCFYILSENTNDKTQEFLVSIEAESNNISEITKIELYAYGETVRSIVVGKTFSKEIISNPNDLNLKTNHSLTKY